jgi:hypothetical protein
MPFQAGFIHCKKEEEAWDRYWEVTKKEDGIYMIRQNRFPNELYIVTIKIKQGLKHDPNNKLTGPCETSDTCTDLTGAHHCFLIAASNVGQAKRKTQDRYGAVHITRIEKARII